MCDGDETVAGGERRSQEERGECVSQGVGLSFESGSDGCTCRRTRAMQNEKSCEEMMRD